MCGHEDNSMVWLLRLVNTAITVIIWVTWIFNFQGVALTTSSNIGIVQVKKALYQLERKIVVSIIIRNFNHISKLCGVNYSEY